MPTKTSVKHPAVSEHTDSNIGSVIRLLVDELGEVIISQSGDQSFQTVETIRTLAKSWRAGDHVAGIELKKTIAALVEQEQAVANLVKAFSTYFQLVNLAEEHQRVRILNERAEAAFVNNLPMDESVLAACQALQREGVDARAMQAILDRLEITPVFTAHPTESRRRSIRQILKHVSQLVERYQSSATRECEKPELADRIYSHIALLWQSDDIRDRPPTVMDEVRNTGLYFFEETLLDLVPQIYGEVESAMQQTWPNDDFEIPSFLTYGSWIGGDRDGNPLVTNEVTENALRAHKDLILKRYASDLQGLYEMLSVSRNRTSFDQEFLSQLQANLDLLQPDPEDVVHRFEMEPYRQQLILMYRRVECTRAANRESRDAVPNLLGYSSADLLLRELQTIDASLKHHKGEALTRGLLAQLIRRVKVFGFHLATIDVRQHAGRHRQAVDEILSRYRMADGYCGMPENDKVSLLSAELQNGRPFTARLDFSESTNDIVSVFRLIARAQSKIAEPAMRTYIISMTESVSNMLEVLLLMQDAGLVGKLDLVPLFETVEDLRRAPETMKALFANENYRRHLELRDWRQQIMIGYSDSNKDGGYLRANWMLFTSQRNLARTCAEHNISLTLFHGRGGSLGRGGGPANRAILAQPTESVNGRIRLTEQGEVVSSRYSNPSIARRHLQQLLHAVLSSTGDRTQFAEIARWESNMDEISQCAFAKYRSLVEHQHFIEYFQSATPIELVENLNIGSRPSRRKASLSLNDLRAIPWVFSWTQSRANIASWYGVGSGIQAWCGHDQARTDELREMIRVWPFFRTLMTNVHVGLGRADMGIARLYAELAPESARQLYDNINEEFELSCRWVLAVTGHAEILDSEPWLQHSIRMRNPYVDPLNHIQVALLSRLRDADDLSDSTRERLIGVLANSVNGIAAGLQNVG